MLVEPINANEIWGGDDKDIELRWELGARVGGRRGGAGRNGIAGYDGALGKDMEIPRRDEATGIRPIHSPPQLP